MQTVTLLFVVALIGTDAREYIKIGGLFDNADDRQESVFQYAIEAINSERTFLPERHELQARPIRVPRGNSFAISQHVCSLLKDGVIGIFGPSTGNTAYHVQSVCDAVEIPHIEARMDPDQKRSSCLVNLYPEPTAYGNIFVSLVELWGWSTFTILYENSDSFPKISELMKMYDPNSYKITVRQLDLGLGNNYRSILHHAKKSQDKHFVIDCSIEILYDVLIQAQQVGLMSDEHNYIITNPDMHTLDMEPFQYGGANITGVRLVDPEDPYVIEVVQFWNVLDKLRGKEEELIPEKLTSDVALMHDAVYVFASGLKELNNITRYYEKSFDCTEEMSWEHGFTMINYMKTANLYGLTRGIKFDRAGFRSDFLLDVIELTSSGIEKVAVWNSTEPKNITRINIKPPDVTDLALHNRTFIIVIAISPPLSMYKVSSGTLEGNERFEGFAIELIQELATMLGFNYTFILQEDGANGSLNKTSGEWDGMIGKVIARKADLAIADLTITTERDNAVDFTIPFMNLGISILYKKPTKTPPSLFSFMAPFSTGVWMMVGTAYIGVSVLIFIMARFTPEEWQNPYPCIEEPEQLENQFSMPNSLWFVIGAVLQQGSEIAPVAMSTRTLAGVWWFFTLIMVSSYTANLAAFLTVEDTNPQIKNVEDLASNPHGITYGAKKGGATIEFFKDADNELYQSMYYTMMNNSQLLMPQDVGIKRVQEEKYAYLMESTAIEYTIERNCDLAQVGNLLDEKGYGIAMRKNSVYRNIFSAAVLKLQEQGKLHDLKIKWWKEQRAGPNCPAGAASDDLGLENVGGVFVVLIGGSLIGLIIAIVDMLVGVYHRSVAFNLSFKSELWEELKFIATTTGNTKPVRHSKSSGGSNRSSASGKSADIEDQDKSYGKKSSTNGGII